jgi:acyl-CoA reductase-like NAD-dependent aldehyde dehydrogenase
VLALAQEAREVATAVIDNVDFVQFTGSSAIGRKVMERAAHRVTPVSLELGGQDPMIVLEDADVDRSMACMTDETFGPALPIMKAGTVEEAIRLANDSEYDLSAAVFSGDVDRRKTLRCGLIAARSTSTT